MTENIPAELAFEFEFGSHTEEQKQQMIADYQAKNGEAGQSGGNPGNDAAKKTAEEAAKAATGAQPSAFDFKKFGDDVDSEDTLKGLVELGRSYKSKQQQIDEVFQVASQVKEHPIPEKYRSAINFYKNTGIDDDVIARNVTSINKESIQNDPLSVLTAAYIMENKELAANGWEAMRKFVAREQNLNPDMDMELLSDDEKQMLSIKATQAMKKMEGDLEKLGKSEDFYTSLQQEREQTVAQIKERQETWKPHVKKITEELAKGVSIKVNHQKFGEIELPVTIGEGDSKNIIKSLGGFIANLPPDEKGIQQLKDTVIAAATGGQSKLAELFSSAIPLLEERMTGVILKELKQKQANGQDIFVAHRSNPGAEGQKSFTLGEALDQFNSNR